MEDFITFINYHIEWSRNTFGKQYSYQKILNHIQKELAEISENPTDLEEWIDVMFLALDGAWRSGHTADEIFSSMKKKQAKNIDREWNIGKGDNPNEHKRM